MDESFERVFERFERIKSSEGSTRALNNQPGTTSSRLAQSVESARVSHRPQTEHKPDLESTRSDQGSTPEFQPKLESTPVLSESAPRPFQNKKFEIFRVSEMTPDLIFEYD